MDVDLLGLQGSAKPPRQGVATVACKVVFSSCKVALVAKEAGCC